MAFTPDPTRQVYGEWVFGYLTDNTPPQAWMQKGGGLVPPPPATVAFDFIFGALDPRVTAAGGVNGTRTDAAGKIVAAVAPRRDYHPVTGAPLGVLIEEARTNILHNAIIGGAGLISQAVNLTMQPYTMSFYGTGTIEFAGEFAGRMEGAGEYPARRVVTFTPLAPGVVILNVTGTVQYAQLEAGAFATSFIPTGEDPVTRTLDQLSMTGVNFSSWFNAATGTFLTSAIGYAPAGNHAVMQVDGGAGANKYAAYYDAVNNGFVVTTGGVLQANLVTLHAPNIPFRVAASYQANLICASINGNTAQIDNIATLPVVNRALLGRDDTGAQVLNGHLRAFTYWNTRLTNAQLEAISTVPAEDAP